MGFCDDEDAGEAEEATDESVDAEDVWVSPDEAVDEEGLVWVAPDEAVEADEAAWVTSPEEEEVDDGEVCFA